MSHEWTMKFIKHRVADCRILRPIQEWLKAGIKDSRPTMQLAVRQLGDSTRPRVRTTDPNLSPCASDRESPRMRDRTAACSHRSTRSYPERSTRETHVLWRRR